MDATNDFGTSDRPAALLPVFVITGPSGVGKGTLIRLLLERRPELGLAISATTREPRPGEVDGVDYYFHAVPDFERLISDDALAEHASYSGNFYGTLRSELVRHTAAGRGVVLEIELQGARQIRQTMPEAMQIFIAPPSAESLRERLIGRGTDTAEQIDARLQVAEQELASRQEFEHVIVNDRLEDAVRELDQVVATRLGMQSD